jgi:hypothetical protein
MTKTEEMSLIPWFSELDVSWRHQELAKLFSPGKGKELKSKANVESMKNCEKDCEASNKREPVLENNDYWWCAGCLGPLYPLTGHVGNHIGGIQSSSLIMHRALAKIHFLRTFFEWPTGYDPNEYCHQRVFNYLPKTFYKTQLVYPTPDKKTTKIGNYKKGYCHPFGQSVQGWATAKKKSEAQQRPDGGEDFTYLVWTKVQCCITPTFGIDILQSINEQIENGINHFMNALPDTLQNLYQDRDKIANGVKSISGLEEKAANVLNRVKELPTAMNKNYSNLRDLELQKLQNQLNEPNEVSNNKIKHFGGQK